MIDSASTRHAPTSTPKFWSDLPFARLFTQPIAARLALAITAFALLAAMLFAIARRGHFYDEFFTYYVTSPAFGLRTALVDHWLTDNHPPLFYALVRAIRWAGLNIPALRAINVVFGLVAFALGMMVVRRDRGTALLAVTFFLFLAAQPEAMLQASSLRSYFLSLCSTSLLVLTLSIAYLDGEAGGRRWRWTLAGAIFLSFNNHIATTIVSGAIMFAFLVALAARRNLPLLRAVLPPTMLSGAIFAAVTAIQLPLWESNTRSFWIPEGLGAALGTIGLAARAAAAANLPILVAGAAGIGLLLADAIRRAQRTRDLELALVLGAGGLLAIAILLTIHIWRPVVVAKYLVGLIPPLAMMLAIGVQRALRRTGDGLAALLLVAATGASLFSISHNVRGAIAYPSWDGTASFIGDQVSRCPGALVHIDPAFWNADTLALKPDDNAAVVPLAYRMMAERFGFRVEPADSRRVSPNCPTLFWTEHYLGPVIAPAPVFQHVRKQGFPVAGLAVYKRGLGWIASTAALDTGE